MVPTLVAEEILEFYPNVMVLTKVVIDTIKFDPYMKFPRLVSEEPWNLIQMSWFPCQ
jgi:hypothetical protein